MGRPRGEEPEKKSAPMPNSLPSPVIVTVTVNKTTKQTSISKLVPKNPFSHKTMRDETTEPKERQMKRKVSIDMPRNLSCHQVTTMEAVILQTMHSESGNLLPGQTSRDDETRWSRGCAPSTLYIAR
jgi:hypothetical protein